MQNQLKTSPNKSTFLSRGLSTTPSIGESRRCEHDARVADQKTIGIRIAKLRSDRNASQEKFAEVLGVSRNTLGCIERGKTPPSPAALRNLFEHTGMTPNQLFLTQEAQTTEGRFAQMTADLEPSEIEELLRWAEYTAAGMIEKRKRQT